MTVKQLRKLLKSYPKDAKVTIDITIDGEYYFLEIDDATYTPEADGNMVRIHPETASIGL